MNRNLLKRIFCDTIPNDYKQEFADDLERETLVRGKHIAITIIAFELVMLVAMVFGEDTYITNQPYYFYLYIAMILVMVAFLGVYWKYPGYGKLKGRVRTSVIVVFTTFILFWSAGVSLLDQEGYGQITAYVIAIIGIAVITPMKPQVILGMFVSVHAMFVALIPIVQHQPDVVYGNLVNSTIMVCLSFVIARRLHNNRVDDFINRKTIKEKNEKLYDVNQRLSQSNDRLNETNEKLFETNQKLNKTNEKLSETNLKLKEANEKLELLSITDPMSGLFNRRKFDEALTQEWDRRKRYQETISLIFIDIDFFKRYNDNYGHQSGDLCIKRIAEVIMNVTRRASDISARYGGEEFVVVIPRVEQEKVIELAEIIRASVQKLKIPHAYSTVSEFISVSLGVCTVLPSDEIGMEEFIGHADKALYMAKQNNRNQVAVYRN